MPRLRPWGTILFAGRQGTAAGGRVVFLGRERRPFVRLGAAITVSIIVCVMFRAGTNENGQGPDRAGEDREKSAVKARVEIECSGVLDAKEGRGQDRSGQ